MWEIYWKKLEAGRSVTHFNSLKINPDLKSGKWEWSKERDIGKIDKVSFLGGRSRKEKWKSFSLKLSELRMTCWMLGVSCCFCLGWGVGGEHLAWWKDKVTILDKSECYWKLKRWMRTRHTHFCKGVPSDQINAEEYIQRTMDFRGGRGRGRAKSFWDTWVRWWLRCISHVK